jgi:hypothetical protein
MRSSARRSAGGAERAARGAATSPEATMLARFGYLAQGVVYLIIGILAARVAVGGGGGGANIDSRSALHAIYTQPFGQFLLWIVAVGLIGYALFNFARAFLDIEHAGRKPGAMAKRIGYAAVGVIYAGLAIAAIRMTMGAGSGKSSNASAQDWTAHLLDLPFGKFLVVVAGLVMIGFAATQVKEAFTAKFERKLSFGRTGRRLRAWIVGCGRFGMAARAVVFAEIGIFLIIAALRHNSTDAKGVGGALAELVRQPYGHFLLAVVALGFIAYGIYAMAEARYRRIATS